MTEEAAAPPGGPYTRMTSTAQLSYPSGCSDKNPPDRAQQGGAEDESDRRLVQRCAERDPAALREIVARYQPRLTRFLGRLLDSPEDTEEAALDVFLRVWQQAHRFEGRSKFATWLYRIAANVATDRVRQKEARGRTVSFEEGAAHDAALTGCTDAEEVALDRLEREERSRQLGQALQSLRVEDRLLLVLYYTEEMGYEEIGRITKQSYPVLKMRLLRARRRLRTAMEALAAEGER